MTEAVRTADLPREPALLIRIEREWREGLTAAQLYERVRRYWRIRPERRTRSPVLAYGVAGGVIRAVYCIDGWEAYDMASTRKDPDRLDQTPHAAGSRVGFIGRWADERADLVGVRLIDAPKSQNPATYINC